MGQENQFNGAVYKYIRCKCINNVNLTYICIRSENKLNLKNLESSRLEYIWQVFILLFLDIPVDKNHFFLQRECLKHCCNISNI